MGGQAFEANETSVVLSRDHHGSHIDSITQHSNCDKTFMVAEAEEKRMII
jgi:hypothetical protein